MLKDAYLELPGAEARLQQVAVALARNGVADAQRLLDGALLARKDNALDAHGLQREGGGREGGAHARSTRMLRHCGIGTHTHPSAVKASTHIWFDELALAQPRTEESCGS